MKSSVVPDISISRPRRADGRTYDRGTASSRYDSRSHNTRAPAAGLGHSAMPRNADTATAAVVDPWGDGKQRTYATVNRRVDVLEMELSHGRISEAAYRAGRTVQATFEKAGGVAACNWEIKPGDRFAAQRTLIERSLDRAGQIRNLMAHLQGRLGMIDTLLLRRILGDRMSFADCAALQGKSGEKGQNYIARRFRDALEDLAEAWTAKGKVQPAPDDKHRAAAGAAVPRQDGAIVGGATLRRLEAELADLEANRGRRDEVEALRTQIAQLRLSQGLARARETRR